MVYPIFIWPSCSFSQIISSPVRNISVSLEKVQPDKGSNSISIKISRNANLDLTRARFMIGPPL